jgi:GNAT superfamily N-acetyltransferase
MAIAIRPYDDSLWPAISRFLHEHWQPEHPLCQKDLFYWQYQGFGPRAGASGCRVAVDGERIVGFLGAIPGLYLLEGQEVPGTVLALWVVVEEFRNSGLGMLLMREVEKQGVVTVCLGVNPQVARYYTVTGYQYLEALHRYVCPLESDGYGQLLNRPAAAGEVERWVRQARAVDGQMIEPGPIDPEELADLWQRVQGRWRLTLVRTAEFWAWRYGNAVGFKYHFFGTPGQGGIVARIDRIRDADRPGLEGRPVLRIIEILAPDGEDVSQVLAGTLQWARQQGAIAADFQCSSAKMEPWLGRAGLRSRSVEDSATHLPELFSPLRRGAAPINLMVKVQGHDPIAFDSIYCVKSDGDMDRPTRWPDESPA